MNYPLTRHYQRYEYLIEKGYIKDKKVLEIGCGLAAGAMMMHYYAKEVIGADPCLKDYIESDDPMLISGYVAPNTTPGKLDLRDSSWEKLATEGVRADVVVAIEVLEHLTNPARFIDFAADAGEYLFLTTPLAAKTAPTQNTKHIVEYSHRDLLKLLDARFNVIYTLYQTGDLQLLDEAKFRGSSTSSNHVVQMLWCKSKGDRK